MIVVQGSTVQSLAEDLTFKQRITAFAKYRSNQLLAFAGAVYAFWQFLPEDYKATLFTEFPFLAQFKTLIYLIGFGIAFYKFRMQTQVVPVAPDEPSKPVALPEPLTLQPVVTPAEPVLKPVASVPTPPTV